ncbi:hypothetical protein P5673_010161 [Acropora cervicornis]|uniref:Uncharacterized protein n=1 Tax=Acropora cervicornis TaxID=6130 RepID=A0AAD9QR69_ACRCE|nr:hypothetical protein P5673_010161 [Acropora cervicornis]
MTLIASSFELHLKSQFNTTSTVAFLVLSVVLLVAWKYRKSFKQYIKYGRFKILPQMWGRKRVPVENEENYSKMVSGGSSVSLQEIRIDNKSQENI